MILLDNAMFDNGSFECFNFWIADCDGCYQVSHDDTLILHVKELILERMKLGKSHLDTRKMSLVYGSCEVLEIQWG